jgi:hypothetical protein
MMLKDFRYMVKPTGADSPSQNSSAEIYNNTLAVKVWMLLYGSGLTTEVWSTMLLHTVYLHNQLVHLAIKKTPYKAQYGCKPDVSYLKTFGSLVCVKQTGSTTTILPRSLWAILSLTKILFTSTSTPVHSSPTIMPYQSLVSSANMTPGSSTPLRSGS